MEHYLILGKSTGVIVNAGIASGSLNDGKFDTLLNALL